MASRGESVSVTEEGNSPVGTDETFPLVIDFTEESETVNIDGDVEMAAPSELAKCTESEIDNYLDLGSDNRSFSPVRQAEEDLLDRDDGEGIDTRCLSASQGLVESTLPESDSELGACAAPPVVKPVVPSGGFVCTVREVF